MFVCVEGGRCIPHIMLGGMVANNYRIGNKAEWHMYILEMDIDQSVPRVMM